MLRILIISERFAPENTVAAIRMSKVAKYIKEQCACHIVVVTRAKVKTELSLEDDMRYVDKFIFVEDTKFNAAIIKRYQQYSNSDRYIAERRKDISIINASNVNHNFFNAIKNGIRSIIAILWSEYTARCYQYASVREIPRNFFDVVISSFGPESSHYIGRYVKYHHPACIWIADYRDPLYSGEATKGLLGKWARSFGNRITRDADAIVTVSKGFISCLGIDNRDNVFVITNGFDEDDLRGIKKRENMTQKMRFVYIGSLLVGRRDITPILKALEELIAEGGIDGDDISIVYAGLDRNEFELQISQVNLEVHFDIHDMISKKESLESQYNADVLMMATWNTSEYIGSIPLKLYEYMMMKKEILCCVSGPIGKSEIGEVIDHCGVGFCYEQSDAANSFPALKRYILNCYERFKKRNEQSLITDRNEEAIQLYNYRNIAKKFLNVVNQFKGP